MRGIAIFPDGKDLDIRSIVTCEDCVHYEKITVDIWGSEYILSRICKKLGAVTPKDGFCYAGEEADTNDLYEEDE